MGSAMTAPIMAALPSSFGDLDAFHVIYSEGPSSWSTLVFIGAWRCCAFHHLSSGFYFLGVGFFFTCHRRH